MTGAKHVASMSVMTITLSIISNLAKAAAEGASPNNEGNKRVIHVPAFDLPVPVFSSLEARKSLQKQPEIVVGK